MKGTNAAKIGIIAVIVIGVLIWGYSFLNGDSTFNRSTKIYVEYDAAYGLTASSPIKVNGLRVGAVQDIYLKEDNSGKLIVVLKLNEKLNISKSKAFAAVEISSLVGGKQVNLLFPSGGCEEGDCLQNGDTIRGGTRSMLASMLPESEDLSPKVTATIQTIDTVIKQLSEKWKKRSDDIVNISSKEVDAIIANLDVTSKELKSFTTNLDGQMKGLQSNVKGVMSGLSGKDSDVQKTLDNIAAINKSLKTADLSKAQEGAGEAAEKLKKTMKRLDETVKELQITLDKVNSTDGTLGRILHNNEIMSRIDTTDLKVLTGSNNKKKKK